MATMVDALKEALRSAGGRMSRADIKAYIDTHYAGEWPPATLAAHLYACTINDPAAYIYHKITERFLFRLPDNTFEVYDEPRHGPNVWASVYDPVGSDASDAEDLIEAVISLDMADHHDVMPIYSERAKRVLASAKTHAKRLLSETIEPTHLLLGVLQVDADTQADGFASLLFGGHTPSDEQILRRLRDAAPRTSPIRASPVRAHDTDGVLRTAAKAAADLGHNYVTAEHIALALLERGADEATFLEQNGVQGDALRQTLRATLAISVEDVEDLGEDLEDCCYCEGTGVCRSCLGESEWDDRGDEDNDCFACGSTGLCQYCDGKAGKQTGHKRTRWPTRENRRRQS